MSNDVVRGIVIKVIDYKESDKILTLLTFEKGKITIIAKGVKKAKAKLSHVARVLYCGQFELVTTGNRKILVGATMIADYLKLSEDLHKFYTAAHYVDIASCAVMDEQADEEVVRLLLNTLYMLANNKVEIKLLTPLYELRLLALNGFAPEMDCCMECGNSEGEMKFSVAEGGIICCGEGYEISDTTRKAIKYISYCEDKELFKLKVPAEVISQLYFISRQYIERVFERKFNKADTLIS